jgi:phage gp36-like protein
MAYITNADIQTRLGNATYVQLADDNGDGTADTAVVDEARVAAEGELESYLAVRHAVPVDLSVHAELAGLLKSAALELAEYRLRLRRPPVSEDALRRREQIVEWLRGIASGLVMLPSLTTPAGRGTMARSSGEERMLSREEMESF